MVSKLGSKPAVLETVMALLDHCCPLLVDIRCVHMMVERVRMAKLPYTCTCTQISIYYECCHELYMCMLVSFPDLIRRVNRFQYTEVGFGSGTETMCMHTCTYRCKAAHSNIMG